MPNVPETGMPRKDLTLFYVLDTSKSMMGDKISILNRAMEETVDALQEVAAKNADARLKIAVLQFNSGARWVTTNGPEYLDTGDFFYEPLSAGGLTDLGAALEELSSKLSNEEYLTGIMGAMFPILIFMTDGYPTDDWERGLKKARENKWFRKATKIGFAIGDEADATVIASVVGNVEAVIQTTDLEQFKSLLKFVSVTTSKARTSVTTSDTQSPLPKLPPEVKPEIDPGKFIPEEPVPEDDPDGEGGDWPTADVEG